MDYFYDCHAAFWETADYFKLAVRNVNSGRTVRAAAYAEAGKGECDMTLVQRCSTAEGGRPELLIYVKGGKGAQYGNAATPSVQFAFFMRKEGHAMPELPEVETVKRVIEPQIRGRSITGLMIRRPEIIAHPGEGGFRKSLMGRTICGMGRRGKFLMAFLDNGSRIILHLRMTGGLLLAPLDFPEEKHTHLVFRLDNAKELRFSDTRRFGRFWLLQKDEADTYSGISKLGIEPFDPALTGAFLQEHMGKRKRAVKDCLLDQSIVAGIGNIYSDEILFTAGIYPACPANRLAGKDWERLAGIIPQRLSFFIEKNEIAPEEYLQTKGKDYRNTPFLQVYGHAGESCPKCGRTLCRIVVSGRSSVYCPGCQGETAG